MGRKRIYIILLLVSIPVMLSAQLTYGTTGLLHAPSAEMQKDKTVMLGANFMKMCIRDRRMVVPGRRSYLLI